MTEHEQCMEWLNEQEKNSLNCTHMAALCVRTHTHEFIINSIWPTKINIGIESLFSVRSYVKLVHIEWPQYEEKVSISIEKMVNVVAYGRVYSTLKFSEQWLNIVVILKAES